VPPILFASAAAAAAATTVALSSLGFLWYYQCDNDNHKVSSLSPFHPISQTTKLEAAVATTVVVPPPPDTAETETSLMLNWSGTHSVTVANNHFYEPETVQEVETIVAECHKRGQTVRPLGSALSPNAIGFASEGMMSLSNLDQIVEINLDAKEVTVQAGARVSQVVDALREYNLTLPNLASIAEQQMGGFVSVGAHGTGRTVAPVDHYVTRLKIVTPGRGTITLTPEDGDIFHLAKVGLGCLGVVVEVTMQCIPAHRLVEHTFVLTREEAVAQLDELLTQYKHMRYMWIPYTDAVVVVTNHPEDLVKEKIPTEPSLSEDERFAPLRDLLLELSAESDEPLTMESMKGTGFGELRDALLAIDPLNIEHVKKVNAAEAEFWKRNSGYQVKPSDQLLQFDCGGQVRLVFLWHTKLAFKLRSPLSLYTHAFQSFLGNSNGCGKFAFQLAKWKKAMAMTWSL
jgi:L-galactono-1,4-lactone dehydrogenase